MSFVYRVVNDQRGGATVMLLHTGETPVRTMQISIKPENVSPELIEKETYNLVKFWNIASTRKLAVSNDGGVLDVIEIAAPRQPNPSVLGTDSTQASS